MVLHGNLQNESPWREHLRRDPANTPGSRLGFQDWFSQTGKKGLVGSFVRDLYTAGGCLCQNA